MDAIASLREGLGSNNWLLEACLEGVTNEQLHWVPVGSAHSIAATYAHTVFGQDFLVQGMLLQRPLLITSAKTGLSELPPIGSEGTVDWSDWARKVKMDLPAFKEFAKKVYSATDEYLASLKPEALDRQIDIPNMDKQSLNWVIYNILLSHGACHTGEIAATKGIQGLKGYPF